MPNSPSDSSHILNNRCLKGKGFSGIIGSYACTCIYTPGMVIAYQPYFYWTPYQLRKTTELCNFVFPLYLQTHLVYDGERTGVLSNAFNAADMTIENHRTTYIEIFSIV